jgi:hypothetical protein
MTHFLIKLCHITHPASESRAKRWFQECIKFQKVCHITHFLEVDVFYPEKPRIPQNPLSIGHDLRKCKN